MSLWSENGGEIKKNLENSLLTLVEKGYKILGLAEKLVQGNRKTEWILWPAQYIINTYQGFASECRGARIWRCNRYNSIWRDGGENTSRVAIQNTKRFMVGDVS